MRFSRPSDGLVSDESLGVAVLVGGEQADRQPVGGLPQRDDAPAPVDQRIGVLHAGAEVVEIALLVAVEADRADRQRVADDRDVDHRVVALAEAVRVGQAEIDQRRHVEIVEVGALGQDAHRARQRSRSEQRALRSAQELDALDVEQIGVDHRGVADRRDRQLVDIDRDRALQVGVVAVGGDAARGEVVEVLRRAVEHHARRLARHALEADDALGGQLLLAEGGDADRHVLDALGTPGGGDNDVAAAVVGIGRRVLADQGRRRLLRRGGGGHHRLRTRGAAAAQKDRGATRRCQEACPHALSPNPRR